MLMTDQSMQASMFLIPFQSKLEFYFRFHTRNAAFTEAGQLSERLRDNLITMLEVIVIALCHIRRLHLLSVYF